MNENDHLETLRITYRNSYLIFQKAHDEDSDTLTEARGNYEKCKEELMDYYGINRLTDTTSLS